MVFSAYKQLRGHVASSSQYVLVKCEHINFSAQNKKYKSTKTIK